MIAIVTLAVTLSIAMLVTRIGAVALKLTGLSDDIARFQARSAFTGVGFTTLESEKVVNHPVRRRIMGILMLSGNVGIAAVIATMIATFATDTDSKTFLVKLTFLFAFVLAMWVIGTQKWMDQAISKTIEWALIKWTKFDSADYVSLLRLSSGYVVYELEVDEGDWMANKSLAESSLALEGVLVLGILRKTGAYLGSPNGRTLIQVGDVMTVYGTTERLEELNLRKDDADGDQIHEQAIEDQKELSAQAEAQTDGVETDGV